MLVKAFNKIKWVDITQEERDAILTKAYVSVIAKDRIQPVGVVYYANYLKTLLNNMSSKAQDAI